MYTSSASLNLSNHVKSQVTLQKYHELSKMIKLRGSFQKFCTLYVFSLKMNLFYKIHLQAYNVISTVLYQSGPFGQVLYSCLNAFVVDASDYSGYLIRHLLNASEEFPTEWFLQFWEQVKVWWVQPTNNKGVQTGIQHLPKRWTSVIKHNGDYIEGL
jgi:hypothetical protein